MGEGRYELETEEGQFIAADYNQLVASTRAEAESFKQRQREAAAVATKGY
jgi:hypothetical protein